MGWSLVLDHNGESKSFPLPATVGRSPQGQVVQAGTHSCPVGDSYATINHKYLSRLHLQFSLEKRDGGEPETLRIFQAGKNPTFFGHTSNVLSNGMTHTVAAGEISNLRLCFPRELDLPTIRFVFVAAHTLPLISPVAASSLILSLDAQEDSADEGEEMLLPGLRGGGALLDSLTSAKQASMLHAAEPEGSPIHPESSALGSGGLSHPELGMRSEGGLQTSRAGAWDFSLEETRPPGGTSLSTKVQNVPSTLAEHQGVVPRQVKMGFWEWKGHLDGDDAAPGSWKPYKKYIADILESAYRAPNGPSIVNIDDTYAVCFDDANAGMIQFRQDDKTRWRPIRRRGGDAVCRKHVKRVRITHCEASDDSEGSDLYANAKRRVGKRGVQFSSGSDDESIVDDGWLVDDDDLSSDSSLNSESDDSASLASSSSDGEKKRKDRKRKK